jgi:hypothetical protein
LSIANTKFLDVFRPLVTILLPDPAPPPTGWWNRRDAARLDQDTQDRLIVAVVVSRVGIPLDFRSFSRPFGGDDILAQSGKGPFENYDANSFFIEVKTNKGSRPHALFMDYFWDIQIFYRRRVRVFPDHPPCKRFLQKKCAREKFSRSLASRSQLTLKHTLCWVAGAAPEGSMTTTAEHQVVI